MGIPAAKKGDRVVGIDTHIVMVPTPGGPVPTPLPHPFNGILDTSLSSDVYVDGQPAATVGSIATNTPPHFPTPPGTSFQKPPSNKAKIFMGSNSVFINGKPAARIGDTAKDCNDPTDLPVGKVVVPMSTVFIGGAPTTMGAGSSSASGGGGGAAPPAAAKAGTAPEGEAEAGQGEVEGGEGGVGTTEGERTHWVEFNFKDQEGKAISSKKYLVILPGGTEEEGTLGSDGKIRKDGIPPGQAEVLFEGLRNARWSSPQGACGEPVELIVDTVFCREGSQVKFEVYREFRERKKEIVKTLTARVTQKQARAEWQYEYEEQDEGKVPRFIFKATLGEYRVVSNTLEVGDEIELELVDEDGNPVIHTPYVVLTSDGKNRIGHSDERGMVKERVLPLGKCKFRMQDGAEIALK